MLAHESGQIFAKILNGGVGQEFAGVFNLSGGGADSLTNPSLGCTLPKFGAGFGDLLPGRV